MAYANVLRSNANARITYGLRPRSIDILIPNELTASELIDTIKQHPRLSQHMEDIFSIFQIGRNTYNLTFEADSSIDRLKKTFTLETEEDGINTSKGKIYFTETRQPTIKINIRAVPSEVDEAEVRQKFQKYNCGRIKEIDMIFHKGTRIHNGYRQISIENYVPGRIPAFVYLGRAPCKVYLPSEELANQKCNRCLLTGHGAKQCPNETACLLCNEYGHKKNQCIKNTNIKNVLREFPPLPVNRNTGNITSPEQLQVECEPPEAQLTHTQNPSPHQEEVEGEQTNEENEIEHEKEDLFETVLNEAETPESSILDQTITPGQREATNSENSANSDEENLQIVTSDDDTQLSTDKTGETQKQPGQAGNNQMANLRRKFESRNFTAYEFFGAPSPNKRNREQRSPQEENKDTKARKKLGRDK